MTEQVKMKSKWMGVLLKSLSTLLVGWLLIMGVLNLASDLRLVDTVQREAMAKAEASCQGATTLMKREGLIASQALDELRELWQSGSESTLKTSMRSYLQNEQDFSSCVGVLMPPIDGKEAFILEMRFQDMESSSGELTFSRKPASWITSEDWKSLDLLTDDGRRMGVTSPCLLPRYLDDGIQMILPLKENMKPSEHGAIWCYGTEAKVHDKLHQLKLSRTGWSFMVVPDRLKPGTLRVLGYPMNNPYSASILPFDEYQYALPQIRQTISTNKLITQSFPGGYYTSRFFVSTISAPEISGAICIVEYQNELIPAIKMPFMPSTSTTGYLSFAIAGLLLLLWVWTGLSRSPVLLSSLAAIVLVAGLAYTWVVIRKASPPVSDSIIPITSTEVLDDFRSRYLDRQNSLNEHLEVKPSYTTIYIDAVESNGAAGCITVGRAWLRVPLAISEPRPKQLWFPTAVSQNWDVLDTKKDADDEIISLSFRAEFSNMTRATLYPFGSQVLEIPMDVVPNSSETFLLPDVKNYWSMNPTLAPGLASTVDTPGEFYLESYMGMYLAAVNPSDAAVTVPLARNNAPRCVFVFAVLRDLSSIILEDLLPLIAVLAVLFCLILMSTRHNDRRGRLGYDTMQVLVVIGPLMAVLVLNTLDGNFGQQTSLMQPYKQALNASVFGFMMLVVISSYLLQTSEDHTNLLSTHNELAKNLFWPGVVSTWLLITLLMA